LFLEQRDRGADVTGIGGSQCEPLGFDAHLRHVRGREIGASSRLARRRLDLGAYVAVGQGVGNAIVHHRVGR